MSDLLERIDAVTAPVCAWCDWPLGGSVSDDFCTPACQQLWTAYHNDVVRIGSYTEAYYGGWTDAAHYVPHVEVIGEDGREWSLRVPDAQAWLDCAREQATAIPLPDGVGYRHPGPVGIVVEATDDPLEDAQVARIAARRSPDIADAARLEAFADERAGVAGPGVPCGPGLAAAMERLRAAVQDACTPFRQIAEAMVPAWAATVSARLEHWDALRDPHDADPAARALAARRHRNTGPSVHADPRRNRRRPR